MVCSPGRRAALRQVAARLKKLASEREWKEENSECREGGERKGRLELRAAARAVVMGEGSGGGTAVIMMPIASVSGAEEALELVLEVQFGNGEEQ